MGRGIVMTARSLKPEDLAAVAEGRVTARMVYGSRPLFAGAPRPLHGLAYAHKAGLVHIGWEPCRSENGRLFFPVSITPAGVAWLRREDQAAVASLFRPAYVCRVSAASYSMEMA